MLVIVDIEWVTDEHGRGYPTWLAAVRADSDWEEFDRFCAFISPRNGEFRDYSRICRAGASEEDILYAKSAYATFSDFLGWLSDEDVLLLKNREAKEVYEELLASLFSKRSAHRIVCISEMIGSPDGQSPQSGGVTDTAERRYGPAGNINAIRELLKTTIAV